MIKRKVIKRAVIAVIIAAILFVGAAVVSYAAVGVLNPISSGIGLFKVAFTDTAFAEVQKEPKVIFIKPDYGIVKAMEEQGYVFVEEEQMGSMLVFVKDGVKYKGISNGGRISYFRCEK